MHMNSHDVLSPNLSYQNILRLMSRNLIDRNGDKSSHPSLVEGANHHFSHDDLNFENMDILDEELRRSTNNA